MPATTRPSRFPEVPYCALRFLVDRMHATTPDADVEEEIRSRCAMVRKTKAYTPREVRECVRYALQVHADNRALYHAVMSGVLS